MRKRFIYLVMISVMAVSFAGCHDKKAEEDTSGQTQEETEDGEEADEGVTEEFEEGGFGDFE
mgnify:CR=1 FL=1